MDARMGHTKMFLNTLIRNIFTKSPIKGILDMLYLPTMIYVVMSSLGGAKKEK